MPLPEMNNVIGAMAESRRVFYSESDFKHSLSWQYRSVLAIGEIMPFGPTAKTERLPTTLSGPEDCLIQLRNMPRLHYAEHFTFPYRAATVNPTYWRLHFRNSMLHHSGSPRCGVHDNGGGAQATHQNVGVHDPEPSPRTHRLSTAARFVLPRTSAPSAACDLSQPAPDTKCSPLPPRRG